MRRRLSVSARTYITTGSLLLALLLLLWLTYASYNNLLQSNERNTHSYQVIVHTEHLLTALLKVQASTRGYLLTGSEQFLDAVQAGLQAYRRQLHDIRALAAEGTHSLHRLDTLTAQQQTWAAEIARLIESRRAGAGAGAGGADGARTAVELDRAIASFETMQTTINNIIEDELDLLDERARTVRRVGTITTTVLVIGGLCALLFAGVLSLLLGRNMGRLYLAKEAAKKRERHVRAVLDNAAEGIITVDEHGILQSANPALHAMLGYAPGEVVGQSVRRLAAADSQPDGPLGALSHAGELEVRRKNGDVFPVDMTVSEMATDSGRLFVLILQDVSERRQAEQVKAEFVSTVSHELRTPLTSIRGALGLLAGGMAGPIPEQGRKLLDIAHKNSERLVRLINDILDVEKLDAGKLIFNMRPLDLVPMVRHSLETNQPYADSYGVALQLLEAPASAWAMGDADRLEQVLANLTSNAVKFSPAGGTVEVSIAQAAGRIRVAVRDRGPGMPEAFRPTMFQRFSQADSSDTRQKGGTGLGLAICKEIIDRHQGVIAHIDASPGSILYFELPAVQTETPNLDDEEI